MSDNKRPNEREGLTWKEHLFLAVGCLIVMLVIVWAINTLGTWIGVDE